MKADFIKTDTFFNGRIKVKQHLNGYRFSIDAVLLAWFAGRISGEKILDLGTGCGIIPLIMAHRNPDSTIYGIEVQEALANVASENISENSFDNRVTIMCRDMKSISQELVSGPVDLIVTNPPYRKAESGRINPDDQKACARHEILISLEDVINTARRMLRVAGRLIAIYPAERLADMMSSMRLSGIEPKVLRMVHSRQDSEAKLVIVEGVMEGKPGLKVFPPVIIYNDDGSYTETVERMFQP
ncbi:MAG: tRNA1(Val) (adenine(37)-N6)-methyltransferase [Desulfobacterales bacterium]|nr:tRNA1(Val) (adenine(37)-N6)-methyltransferase [Desulfobacterales bacterium]